jgi:hypothetical protein
MGPKTRSANEARPRDQAPRKGVRLKSMAASENICLAFGRHVPTEIRPRILYAFRVFAAIYGYNVTDSDARNSGAYRLIRYGEASPTEPSDRCLDVPSRYLPRREATKSERPIRHRYAEEEIPLFHGLDLATGKPDWLGEIFEWLSASQEREIIERDSVGRIPYSQTIFSREKLSPRKPYASLLMAWMQHALQGGTTTEFLSRAISPIHGVKHAVICSQDIDFYGVGTGSTFFRLIKNLGIAALVSRSWPFFSANMELLFAFLTGKNVGYYLPEMARVTAQRNIHSTMFVIARRTHRRDSNYELAQITSCLADAQKWGHSVELHGSYTSIIECGSLTAESATVQTVTGRKTRGNRQHWLRFDNHEKLFGALAEAELIFDSTLGFSETVGFRNGASFAFPPYDFRSERPHNFLEIPLVLMDVSLEAASKSLGREPRELAEEVLQESRRLGWGGVSILWHNPMEPLHVPKHINQVFWSCAPESGKREEKWMSAEEFISQSLFRYHNAGLLEGVRANA